MNTTLPPTHRHSVWVAPGPPTTNSSGAHTFPPGYLLTRNSGMTVILCCLISSPYSYRIISLSTSHLGNMWTKHMGCFSVPAMQQILCPHSHISIFPYGYKSRKNLDNRKLKNRMQYIMDESIHVYYSGSDFFVFSVASPLPDLVWSSSLLVSVTKLGIIKLTYLF